MENQAISKDLSNSDMVVGPQTGNIAANIAAKPLEVPPPTNQPHGSLPLPINIHPQKEQIVSMEKQGQPATSSSSNTSEKSTEKSAENAATTAATAPAAKKPSKAKPRPQPPFDGIYR